MQSFWRTFPLIGICFLGFSASAQNSADKAFLHRSAQDDVKEVELGKLSLTRSSDPEVKAFARAMIRDHTRLAAKMAPLLKQAGVSAPVALDNENQKLFNRLNALPSADFDRGYVKEMQFDHHHDLSEYEKEIRSTHDSRLKSRLQMARAVIAAHVRMVDNLSRRLGLAPRGLTERDAGRVIR